jgi:hypothetical protein
VNACLESTHAERRHSTGLLAAVQTQTGHPCSPVLNDYKNPVIDYPCLVYEETQEHKPIKHITALDYLEHDPQQQQNSPRKTLNCHRDTHCKRSLQQHTPGHTSNTLDTLGHISSSLAAAGPSLHSAIRSISTRHQRCLSQSSTPPATGAH